MFLPLEEFSNWAFNFVKWAPNGCWWQWPLWSSGLPWWRRRTAVVPATSGTILNFLNWRQSLLAGSSSPYLSHLSAFASSAARRITTRKSSELLQHIFIYYCPGLDGSVVNIFAPFSSVPCLACGHLLVSPTTSVGRRSQGWKTIRCYLSVTCYLDIYVDESLIR